MDNNFDNTRSTDTPKSVNISNNNYYSSKRTPRVSKGLLTSILGGLVLFLLIIALYRGSVGQSPPLLSDLLTLLSKSPLVQIPLLGTQVADYLTAVSWGIFEFAKFFLIYYATLLDFVIFAVNGYISIIQYLYYIVSWIVVSY